MSEDPRDRSEHEPIRGNSAGYAGPAAAGTSGGADCLGSSRVDRRAHDDAYASELERLLSRARQGDQGAVRELLESCRDYLLLIANQEMDADLKRKLGPSDIVQSVMLAIHEHLGDFRGDSRDKFFAWVRQILLHGVNQARRKYKQTKKRDIGRELPLALGQAEPTFDPVDPLHTPHATAVSEEERQAVENAMRRLSADHRQVIEWRNAEQLSFAEIAERLGRSEAAAHKLWARAIVQLKRELQSRGMFQLDR
jgi:RNA polymerase sigma-70 factor, ECF subfamily